MNNPARTGLVERLKGGPLFHLPLNLVTLIYFIARNGNIWWSFDREDYENLARIFPFWDPPFALGLRRALRGYRQWGADLRPQELRRNGL